MHSREIKSDSKHTKNQRQAEGQNLKPITSSFTVGRTIQCQGMLQKILKLMVKDFCEIQYGALGSV
jgi:hypothetical protein